MDIPSPQSELLWVTSCIPPFLCAVILIPQLLTQWSLKVDSWASTRAPAQPLACKSSSKIDDRKTLPFPFLHTATDLSCRMPLSKASPSSVRSGCLTQRWDCLGTVQGMTEPHHHPQGSSFSCRGVRKWNGTLISCVFYGSHPRKSHPDTWQSLLMHTEI